MSAHLPQQWLDKADEDLVVARLVFQENHFAHTCFLSQQSIEKALKAYLIAETNKYPRTHKLVDLLQLCLAREPEFLQFQADCVSVDQYYIPTRYPDGIPGSLPSGLPNAKQAQKAMSAADAILQYVVKCLSPAEDSRQDAVQAYKDDANGSK